MKILTTKFNTKYDTAPFRKKMRISFLLIEGIALAKAEIDSIVENERHPPQNTIDFGL
jgi:peptidyl-dipeptidase Dcp